MTSSPDSKPEQVESEPYVNGLQEWVGESKTALWVIYGVYVSSAAVGLAQFFTTPDVVVLGAVVAVAFITSIVHFWRDVVAPDMRHPRGESS